MIVITRYISSKTSNLIAAKNSCVFILFIIRIITDDKIKQDTIQCAEQRQDTIQCAEQRQGTIQCAEQRQDTIQCAEQRQGAKLRTSQLI